MAFSVQMPALGESVTEGTVTRWLKQEGDRVEVDEPLLEVSTDKVDTEVTAPTSGYLAEIVVQEGDTVDVGTKLAVISSDAPSGDGGGGGGEAEAEPERQPGQARPGPPARGPGRPELPGRERAWTRERRHRHR